MSEQTVPTFRAEYIVEVDGVHIRLGLLDKFTQREMPTVVRRILRERPGSTIVIRPSVPPQSMQDLETPANQAIS